jgi:cytochrome c553
MKMILIGLALGMALSVAPLVSRAQADDAPPSWAYAVNPPDFKVQPDDGTPRHVPDSTAAFTVTQARDLFFALDWHPSDHPPLPDIVADGRKPDVMACGVCHRADGPGGPENASLAGLPAQYIVQQMADFKSGARTTSVPQRIPPQLMIKTAKDITDPEIEQAAVYFSGLKPPAAIKVVETASVPKTRVAGWFLAALSDGETEPIAGRISSRFRKIWSVLRCGTRDHASSPMRRPAAWNRAGNSPPPATERARHARSVMGTD